MNIDNNDHHRTRTLELPYEQPPPRPSRRRSNSAGRQTALQIRASNLVKKLGILTSKLGQGGRIKQSSNSEGKADTPLAENYPYRKARSMDVLRSKPYTSSPMLSMGFDSKQVARSSADGLQESGSDLGDIKSAHARKPSSSNSTSIAQGLAVAAMVAGAGLRPRGPEGPDRHSIQDTDISATLSGMPSNAIKRNKGNDMSVRAAEVYESLAPPPPEKRPGHPRLSTLPPLTFNLKGGVSQDSRPQRFSPSVVVRPPPFPILELPPLPTPVAETPASGSQAQSRTRRGGARLNSMPMLPMEGADERESDPDHENCVLDEDEEGDDDENDEDGIGANDAAGSEDEDEETAITGPSSSSFNATPAPSASFFSRTRTLSPRLTLPTLNSPSLSSLLGGIASGSQSVESSVSTSSASCGHNIREGSASGSAESIKASRDNLPTPKAARSNHTWGGMGNGSSQTDYFSTSGSVYPGTVDHCSQDIDQTNASSHGNPPPSLSSTATATSSTLRTPTARDYPGRQIPMISVAPPSAIQTETVVSGSEGRPWKGKSFIADGLGSGTAVPHLGVKGAPKRPSIYHHASKSMIELFTVDAQSKVIADSNAIGRGASDRDVKGKGKLHAEESVMKLQSSEDQTVEHTLRISGRDRNAKVQEKPLPSNPSTTVPGDATAPSLRRQRSMPTFSISGSPPPYPSFPLPEHLRQFAPLPREDEGTEELPPYSNDIRLAAVMPRKLEFSAPGVSARDRKWRRVHCVLEGTVFRIYDAPPRVSGVSALGGWWERKVGVGDVSSGYGVSGATASSGATTNIVIGRKEPKRRMKWEEELQAEEDAQRAESGSEDGQPRPSTSSAEVNIGSERPRGHRSKLNVAASLLHPNRSKHSLVHAQGSSSSPASPRSSFHSPRTSAESSSPPSARPSVDLSTTASSSSGLSSDAVSANSTSSSSLSALSTSSSASSSHTRRRGHLRSDSAQSSITHSRSSSRAQSPLNPDSQSRPQSRNSTLNSYLYHSTDSSELPEPEEKDLLRVYSLQNAESGLASDYIKRKNVVRVRMEGEQFLLQCKDVASVVEWIEGLQAATNIALDLDERPMPKGPIFPRRRRRRRAQPIDSGSGQAASSDTGSGAGTGSSDRAATS